MTIKHIVINGGGANGLISYGVARYLHDKQFWNIENIKSMYGTSVGGIMCVFLSLKYDMKYLDDYIIKRPWDKVHDKINIDNVLNIMTTRGITSIETFIKNTFELIFEGLNLKFNEITLEEFYNYNKIELHLFTCEINNFKKVNLSYKTHPNLKLIDALSMSAAYPIIFKPIQIDDKCYLDGGVFVNYPLNECIQEQCCELTEILGIRDKINISENKITQETEFTEYLYLIFLKTIKYLRNENNIIEIPYEIRSENEICKDYKKWYELIFKKEMRENLITYGFESAKKFYENLQHKKESYNVNDKIKIIKNNIDLSMNNIDLSMNNYEIR